MKSQLSTRLRAFGATLALVLLPCAHSLAAERVADASATPVRVHVAVYYAKWAGGLAAAPSWIAGRADFAQGDPKSMSAFKGAGGRYAMFYTDPNLVIVARHEPYWDLPEGAFLHDSQGNRISRPYARARGGTDDQFFLNPASADTQTAFARETQKAKASGIYDFVFLDDANPVLSDRLAVAKTSAVELRSDQDLAAGLKTLISQSALPVIANGMLGKGSINPVLAPVLSGALKEGCFATRARSVPQRVWTTTAEALLATTSQGKWAFCMVNGQSGQETQARLFGYASWLLTYDDSHSVIWENMGTRGPNRVEIYPEQTLVPTNALQTPSHVWDLKRAGGVYVREFQRCYYQGKLLGACAAVVNPTRSPVPAPTGYSSQVVLVGGNSLEGGTLDLQPNTTTSLPGGSAAILIR